MSELPDYPAALERALTVVTALARECVPLADSIDRVLARDARSDRDLPPFNRAMMDGYAVRAAEVKPELRFAVAADVPAGASPRVNVPSGSCAKIATGAAVPDGLDAVIPHEQSDRGDPVQFTVASAERGNAIHPRGADARAGDAVVRAGTVLEPHHLGILASIGCADVEVIRAPRAIVLTSGDEVRPSDAGAIEPHHIRNSNAPMLAALLPRFGAKFVRAEHVPDHRETTIHAVARAIEEADIVITVGGVSAGERDFFPAAFDHAGAMMALRGARLQPGRPIQVGRAPDGTVVVALPGNPVSALVTAHLFIWPIIRAMLGLTRSLPCSAGEDWPATSSVESGGGVGRDAFAFSNLPWQSRPLAVPVKPNSSRQAFRPAILNEDGSVTIPKWAGSGDLVHTGPTHGIAALPMQAAEVDAGTQVPFLAWA